MLTPNGDWAGEATSVRFGLTRRAVLGVRVVNATSNGLVRTLLASAERAAGTRTIGWDGRNAGGTVVPDGRYRIEVSATDGAEQASRSATLVLDTTLGGFSASPSLVSLNGTAAPTRSQIGYSLTRGAAVKVQIRRNGKTLHTIFSGTQPAGAYTVDWDGSGPGGKRLPDGALTAVAVATTSLGVRTLSRPFRLDTRAPAVRVLRFSRKNGVVRLRFSLSEAAQVRIWWGRNSWSDGGSVDRAGRAGEQVFTPQGARVRLPDRRGGRGAEPLVTDPALLGPRRSRPAAARRPARPRAARAGRCRSRSPAPRRPGRGARGGSPGGPAHRGGRRARRSSQAS